MAIIEDGTKIIDENGRKGIITERRENGFFARPADTPYVIDDTKGVTGVAGAQLISATWWQQREDGAATGKWYDSPLHSQVTVRRKARD